MNLNFPLTRFQVQIIAAVGACMIVGLGLVFTHIFVEPHQQLTQAARERAGQVRDSLVAYDERHGFDALVRFVRDKTAWHDPDAPFVSIRDPQGEIVLHTSSEVTPQAAWNASKLSIRYFSVGWGLTPHLVHVATAPLSKGQLLVGQSEVKAAQRRDQAILGFAVLSTALLLLILLAALLFSSRSRARLDEMTSTLFAFAAGDVDRRAPMFGHKDSLSDLALAINSSLDFAQRLQRNLNHMSADIAHNLKKPLTRLRQRLELVSKCDEGSEELPRKIDESIEEIDSLVVIFEALLNIGQLQSGDRRASFVHVDMPSLLTHIADVYEPIIADHGHHLQMSINTEQVRPVSGDRELLMEMIVNFVENAIQYCPSGTTIKIGLEQFLNGLDVYISDNGTGVPASEVQNLFERFYRLEASPAKPGHGLGIPFAVAIADLHGAHVEIGDNHPGLSVVIHFPNVSNNRHQPGLKPRSGYVLVPRPLINP